MSEEIFLIDSCTIITPYRQYYAPDLAPSFWNKLSEAFSSGRIVMLDIVLDEFKRGTDGICGWVKNQTGFETINHKEDAIKEQFDAIIDYLKESGYYKPRAVVRWKNENIADAWLIATAKVKGCVLITFEARSGGFTEGDKHKGAKIPDVADHFGVETEDLFYMMRALGISI